MVAIIWRQCDCSMASAYCRPSARATLGGLRIHDPGSQDRQVPVPGHADGFEAGIAGLARRAHPVAHAALIVTGHDVDPTQQ